MDPAENIYEFDLDHELTLLSESYELELIPDDSEIGTAASTLEETGISETAPSGSTGLAQGAAPPEKKKKKPRVLQECLSRRLEDILPEAVGLLRDAVTNQSILMSTPAEKEISVLREHLSSQSDSNLQTIAEYVLEEVWKVAESGKGLTVGPAANNAMWRNFHRLRQNSDLGNKWRNCFSQIYSAFAANMLLQEVLDYFLRFLLTHRNQQPLKEQEKLSNFNSHEEEVLRYVAGFVPYALSKRYRRMQSKTAKEYLAFLKNLRVSQDRSTHATSFLEYTSVWTTLQNRGGLYCVSDECYMLFRAMEIETWKHLGNDLLVAGRSQPIKEKLQDELSKNMYVTRMWGKLQGHDLTNGDGLLKTIVNYWIEIRMRAIIKLFLEKRRQEIGEEKREKGLRKKLQKKK